MFTNMSIEDYLKETRLLMFWWSVLRLLWLLVKSIV